MGVKELGVCLGGAVVASRALLPAGPRRRQKLRQGSMPRPAWRALLAICLPLRVQAAAEGRLLEVFGTGTACIVQPVGALVRGSGEVFATKFDPTDPSSMCARIQRTLVDIQYGRLEHPWSVPIE